MDKRNKTINELVNNMNYKYKSLSEFRNNNTNEYNWLAKNNLLNQLCNDMNWIRPSINRKSSGFWTKEECIRNAKQYQSILSFRKNSTTVYYKAKKRGWLNECIKHMPEIINPKLYWTKEKCMQDALRYKTKISWKTNSKISYNISKQNNWFEECTKHITAIRKPHGYWTKERCFEEAKKYKTSAEFNKKSGGALASTQRNGWYLECLNIIYDTTIYTQKCTSPTYKI